MNIEVTDEERHFLGFHLACQLEDYGKQISKLRKQGKDMTGAQNQWNRLALLIYTKVIPDSFSGPRPSYWSKVESKPFANPFSGIDSSKA